MANMRWNWFVVLVACSLVSNKICHGSIELTWETSAQSIPTSTYAMMAGIYDSNLVIVGGNYDNVDIIDTSDVISGSSSAAAWKSTSWDSDSNIGSLTEIYGSICSTTVDNYLYIVSPWDTATIGKMLIYDINSESVVSSNTYDYTTIASPSLQYPFVVNNGSHIFVIGGFSTASGYQSPSKTLQIYNIGSDSWTLGDSMNQERTQPFCGFIESKNAIYCMGGWDNNAALNSIEKYDISTNIWTTLTNVYLSQARHGGGTLVYGNYIFCISGTTELYVSGGGEVTTIEIFDASKEEMMDTTLTYPIGDTNFAVVFDSKHNKTYTISGYYSQSTIRIGTLIIDDVVTSTAVPTTTQVATNQAATTMTRMTTMASETGNESSVLTSEVTSTESGSSEENNSNGNSNSDSDSDQSTIISYAVGILIGLFIVSIVVMLYCRFVVHGNNDNNRKNKETEPSTVVIVQNNTKQSINNSMKNSNMPSSINNNNNSNNNIYKNGNNFNNGIQLGLATQSVTTAVSRRQSDGNGNMDNDVDDSMDEGGGGQSVKQSNGVLSYNTPGQDINDIDLSESR